MKLKSTSKALAKAIQPIQKRGFRPLQLRVFGSVLAGFGAAAPFLCALSLLMAGLCPANGGEPCHWERKPNNPDPFQFYTYHGETIDFRCTFIGFSSLPFTQSPNPPILQSTNAPRLYYQTNGMASAWWDIPATVSTTVVTNCQPPITNYSLSAVFPPSADPGAERLTVFFGAPSNAYAAAQVRFRNSPGATPNVLPPPDTIEWLSQLTAATNAISISLMAEIASATNALAESQSTQMSHVSQASTNYTDSATNSLSTSFAPTITNTVTKAYVESLGIESGISASTATNIANSATNFLTRAEAISGYTDFVFSNKTDGVILTNAEAIYFPATSFWYLNVNDEFVSGLVASKDTVCLEFPSSGMYDVVAIRHRITPTALSQLTNDVGFVTKTITNNLHTIYFKRSDGLGILEWSDGLGELSLWNGNLFISDGYVKTLIGFIASDWNGYSIETQNLPEYLDSREKSLDTTYRRTIGITNLNQTVQYVNITDATPTTLAISMPTNGVTKDWIVYVSAVTNVTLSLPSATWWMADVAYTNDVPPATPTAFYFSQIATNIFYLGRQELTEVAP